MENFCEGNIVCYIFENIKFISSAVEEVIEASLPEIATIIYTRHKYIIIQGSEPCKVWKHGKGGRLR